MSVVRLYFDADSMERGVISGLRLNGVDAITALEAGMADGSDEEQFEFAQEQGRTLFSFKVSDFQRIHTEYLRLGRSHAGIILAAQQRYSVGERIRRLVKLAGELSAEQIRDRLEFLVHWG